MTRRLRPLILLLAFGSLLVASWAVLSTEVASPTAEQATPTSWTATFADIGADTDYLVAFDVDGLVDTTTITTYGLAVTTCDVVGNGLECRARLTLGVEDLTASIGVPDTAELEVTAIDIARQTRRAPFDGAWLGNLFLLSLLFVPIIVVTHNRNEALSQWMLVGFSLSALGVLQFGFTLALLGVLLVFYALGRWYRRSDRRSSRFILNWLTVTVLVLLVLKNFKAVFFLPFDEYGALSLVLPLGTSYFLIRLLDLQLRWHRGQLEDLNLRRYLVYVVFPGTLVAGPIELVDTFFKNRATRITADDIGNGVMRIALGVAKKTVIVDALLGGLLFGSGLFDEVLTDPGGSPTAALRFCLFAYLFAYLDFSAYSDIAIGLSRLFGHTIGENFRWPILAPDLAEFWRRWHISLSGWAFRNVFFPVMASTRKQTAGLVVTLLVIGMWHDLSLAWVTWGLYHGIGMAVLAWWPWNLLPESRWKPMGGIAVTNLYVAAGFAFVSIRDYSLAWRIFVEFLITPVRLVTG